LGSKSKVFLIDKRRFKRSSGVYTGLIMALAIGVFSLTACGVAQGTPAGEKTSLPAVQASPTAVATMPAATTTASPAPTGTPTPVPATDTLAPSDTPTPVLLVGAGDIANCESPGAEITAKLIEHALLGAPGAAVFTAGDNTNELVTDPAPLKPCFDQTWGRFKERIRPAPGNHDYFFE
jgi:hypothetical protein